MEEFPIKAAQRSGTLNELEKGNSAQKQTSDAHARVTFTTAMRQLLPWRAKHTEEDKTIYSLRQAFFIVAGGLAVETGSFQKEDFLTITPAGAVELARQGLLSPISKDIIDDKTKADPITKLIVCIQAGWFVIQSIARTAQNLPLTLLEIHVLAHVLVALLTYLFWFAKPYDMQMPVVLTKPEIVETAALFSLDGVKELWRGPLTCMLKDDFDLSKITTTYFFRLFSEEKRSSSERGPQSGQRSPELTSACNGLEGGKTDSTNLDRSGSEHSQPLQSSRSGMRMVTLNASRDLNRRTAKSPLGSSSSHQGQADDIHIDESISGSQQGPLLVSASPNNKTEAVDQLRDDTDLHEPQLHTRPSAYFSTSGDVNRAKTTLRLAQSALQRLKSNKVHFAVHVSDNSFWYPSKYLVSTLSTWRTNEGYDLSVSQPFGEKTTASPRSNLAEILRFRPGSVWLLLLFMSYGAFHLSAWNSRFPSTVELWLWRGSGLAIVGGPLVVLLTTYITTILTEPFASAFALVNTIDFLLHSTENAGSVANLKRLVGLICFALLSVFVLSLPAARLYLLVEAFVSLRAPVPGTYQTVEWSQFWPHG